MRSLPRLVLLIAVVTLLPAFPVFAAPADAGMPAYDEDGQLLLPEGYRQWTLVGSSLGLSYSEGGAGMQMFHHTLMEPSAYEHFTRTGEFREGTMLALILQGLGEGVLPSRRGQFATDVHAVELAVKDSSRFEESWAYYNFGSPGGLLDRAQAFPKATCYSCHAEHAQRDNVFLQFYGLLADAAPAGVGATSAAAAEAQDPGAADEAESPAAVAVLALDGLDPVLLAEGREELGKPEIVMTHAGFRYQFLSEPSRARFEQDPARYAIQNETCLVVPGAPLDPSLWSVHEGRIYAFASAACVASFESDPEGYLPGEE